MSPYLYCQFGGWISTFLVLMMFAIARPTFSSPELIYGAVLVSTAAIGSHVMRIGFRRYFRNRHLVVQLCALLFASVLAAIVAGCALLVCVLLLAQSGITSPIPDSQRGLVFQIVFVGNSLNMLFVLLLWSAIYFSVSKVRQLQQTNELLKAAQLEVLIQQLNPHFLFNTINNIRALILEDPSRAREMLARLAEMLRYSLHSDQQMKVSLQTELAVVAEYIEICSVQFEERLRYQLECAEDCLPALIPKLLLQLCVENAVKHGISNLVKGGVVQVQIRRQEQQLHLEISNDGPWHTPAPGKGVGLSNIRQRLALLYPNAATIKVQQLPSQVRIHIILPLEFADESTDH